MRWGLSDDAVCSYKWENNKNDKCKYRFGCPCFDEECEFGDEEIKEAIKVVRILMAKKWKENDLREHPLRSKNEIP